MSEPTVAAGPADAGRPSGRRSGRPPMPAGFWAVWTTVVIDMVGFGIAFPVLGPFARDRFGATGFMVGAIGASFSLAQFVVSPLLGRLSDRIGRKPVLVLSLLGTSVASFGTAYAGSAIGLLIWRAFDGASGATVGVANAVVADLAPPQRRAPLLGMIGAAFGIGFTVGPAVGAVASHVGGVRAPFILTGVVAVLNAIATAIRMPETRGLAVTESGELASKAGGSTLASTWRDGGLPRLFALSVVSVFAFAGFEQTYGIFAEDRLGLTTKTIGYSLALVGVIVMIVQGALIRPVSQKVAERSILQSATLLVAVGFALLSFARGWGLLIPSLVLLAAGQGFLSPTLTSVISARIEPTRRGAVLGVQQSWSAMARVVGPLTAGFLFDHVSSVAPMVSAAVLFVVTAVLSIGAVRPRAVDSALEQQPLRVGS